MTKLTNKIIPIDKLFTVSLSDGDNKPGSLPLGKKRLVSSGVSNNGIVGRFDTNTKLYPKWSLTCDMFGNCFVQKHDFVTVSHGRVNILLWKNSAYAKPLIALYVATAINRVTRTGKYGFSNMLSSKRLKSIDISLPVTDSGQLDVQYMEQYIKRVEAKYIKRVEAYLATLGYESLDDCELSSQDLKVLSGPDKWGEFVLSGLFDHIEQGSRLKKSDQLPGDLPYVMSGTTNQGIANCISNNLNLMPAGSLTVDILGNVFYRNYQYGLSDDVGCYYDKQYSYKQMLYLATAISKAMTGKYSYGKKFRSSQSSRIKIKLPVMSDGKPDYNFMDQYITAIEKKKVLKLKQAMDHKLELYREVSHQN